MSTPAETVREFMAASIAAWPEGDAAKLASFFSEDDIGEENRGEDTVLEAGRASGAGQECLYLVECPIHVVNPWETPEAGALDVASIRDVLGQVATVTKPEVWHARVRDDERGRPHRGQDAAHLDGGQDLTTQWYIGRAHRHALDPCEPLTEARAWGERAVDCAYLMEAHARRANKAVFDRVGVGPGTRLLDIACCRGYAAALATERGALVSGLSRDSVFASRPSSAGLWGAFQALEDR